MKKGLILGLFLLLGWFLFGQSDNPKDIFADYETMRAHIGQLYQQRQFAEAAEVLDKALLLFPDHLEANTFNLCLMNVHLNRLEKALEALEYGHDHGIWYGKYTFLADVWKPLTENDGFERIWARNEAMRLEGQKKVSAKLKLCAPEGFTETKKYPLFIALHGGGENLDVFIPQWTSSLMKRDFVVAYPQSSQMISMAGFNWTEDLEQTKKEILTAYQAALQSYSIDTEQVIIGGFSSGGVAALVAALEETIPVSGFVVLCPAKPDIFTPEIVQKAKSRGIKGTLITTEMDGRLASQKEMARIMDEEGFPLTFIVTPNIGHWYPKDLATQIDQAIKDILK